MIKRIWVFHKKIFADRFESACRQLRVTTRRVPRAESSRLGFAVHVIATPEDHHEVSRLAESLQGSPIEVRMSSSSAKKAVAKAFAHEFGSRRWTFYNSARAQQFLEGCQERGLEAQLSQATRRSQVVVVSGSSEELSTLTRTAQKMGGRSKIRMSELAARRAVALAFTYEFGHKPNKQGQGGGPKWWKQGHKIDHLSTGMLTPEGEIQSHAQHTRENYEGPGSGAHNRVEPKHFIIEWNSGDFDDKIDARLHYIGQVSVIRMPKVFQKRELVTTKTTAAVRSLLNDWIKHLNISEVKQKRTDHLGREIG